MYPFPTLIRGFPDPPRDNAGLVVHYRQFCHQIGESPETAGTTLLQ